MCVRTQLLHTRCICWLTGVHWIEKGKQTDTKNRNSRTKRHILNDWVCVWTKFMPQRSLLTQFICHVTLNSRTTHCKHCTLYTNRVFEIQIFCASHFVYFFYGSIFLSLIMYSNEGWNSVEKSKPSNRTILNNTEMLRKY